MQLEWAGSHTGRLAAIWTTPSLVYIEMLLIGASILQFNNSGRITCAQLSGPIVPFCSLVSPPRRAKLPLPPTYQMQAPALQALNLFIAVLPLHDHVYPTFVTWDFTFNPQLNSPQHYKYVLYYGSINGF